MISNRNDIFRCLLIGSCLFIFWGVIIIWIVSYQNLCHALHLTLYFSKHSGVTIIWNSTHSMPWGVPTNWNMSSNWNQWVREFRAQNKMSTLFHFIFFSIMYSSHVKIGLMPFPDFLCKMKLLFSWIWLHGSDLTVTFEMSTKILFLCLYPRSCV